MKRILLVHLTLFLIITQAFSQQLLNTQWQVFIGNPVDTMRIEFIIDTSILYSSDTILVISNYYETNDTMSIMDIGGPSPCPFSDTGLFKFELVGDTLKFFLISDPCLGRPDFFTNGNFIKLKTGISNSRENSEVEVNVYPNPNPEGIFNFEVKRTGNHDLTFEVYNILGKRLKRINNLRNTSITIDLSTYANGVYIAKIGSKHFSKIFKLIK